MKNFWKGFHRPKRLESDRATLTPTSGQFVAEPFERGFGTTIGNSLRRALLSSIQGAAVTAGIYSLVAEMNGSFSAEHGVGRLKRDYLAEYRGDGEMALMKTLKKALDPHNILNPGKVI